MAVVREADAGDDLQEPLLAYQQAARLRAAQVLAAREQRRGRAALRELPEVLLRRELRRAVDHQRQPVHARHRGRVLEGQPALRRPAVLGLEEEDGGGAVGDVVGERLARDRLDEVGVAQGLRPHAELLQHEVVGVVVGGEHDHLVAGDLLGAQVADRPAGAALHGSGRAQVQAGVRPVGDERRLVAGQLGQAPVHGGLQRPDVGVAPRRLVHAPQRRLAHAGPAEGGEAARGVHQPRDAEVIVNVFRHRSLLPDPLPHREEREQRLVCLVLSITKPLTRESGVFTCLDEIRFGELGVVVVVSRVALLLQLVECSHYCRRGPRPSLRCRASVHTS